MWVGIGLLFFGLFCFMWFVVVVSGRGVYLCDFSGWCGWVIECYGDGEIYWCGGIDLGEVFLWVIWWWNC